MELVCIGKLLCRSHSIYILQASLLSILVYLHLIAEGNVSSLFSFHQFSFDYLFDDKKVRATVYFTLWQESNSICMMLLQASGGFVHIVFNLLIFLMFMWKSHFISIKSVMLIHLMDMSDKMVNIFWWTIDNKRHRCCTALKFGRSATQGEYSVKRITI